MTIDFALLPRRELAPGTRLYRVHRKANGPLYFSDSGFGRFDPVAASGRGTCYLAEDPLGAWVESFRTTITLLEDDVRARAMTTVELVEPLTVVDLTDRRGLVAGATTAISAGVDYAPGHEIASRVQRDWDGIRWRLRHDLAQELIGIGVFGPVGSQPDDRLAVAATVAIGTDLIRAAEDAFGYRVVPVSAS